MLSNKLKGFKCDNIYFTDAFVKERQILDAALVTNEVVDLRRKQGELRILCELDLEKAYDHINWAFKCDVIYFTECVC